MGQDRRGRTDGVVSRPRHIERVVEHRSLEIAQRRGRIEPELVGQMAAVVLVGLQRLGLATGAIQRGHQQRPGPVAQRVLRGEADEVGERLLVASDREQRVEPLLVGEQPQLLEP